jgi:zinc and cadmium transporter
MDTSVFFYAFVLFAVAVLGGILFFATQKQTGTGLKILLAYSAAYLLGLTLLHLFPELFASGIPYAGWYVMAGFLLQVILDFFSHGVEHGHTHVHKHQGFGFLMSIMISLWIHAFIEGMPFGGTGMHHHHHGHSHGAEELLAGHDHRGSLLIGISLHKITEAMVFAALLVSFGMTKMRAFLWLLVFAAVAPLGAITHAFLDAQHLEGFETFAPKVTGVLIGILLHVSTTIIFESEEGHRFNWMKFLAILVGIATAGIFSSIA